MTAPTVAENNALPFLVQTKNNQWVQNSYNERAFQGVYSSNLLEYGAFARPGSDVNAPVWQLFLCSYDGSGNLTSITWPVNAATGLPSRDYIFIQADYASYTYA